MLDYDFSALCCQLTDPRVRYLAIQDSPRSQGKQNLQTTHCLGFLHKMTTRSDHANRKFYEIPEDETVREYSVSRKLQNLTKETSGTDPHGVQDLLTYIYENIIGRDKTFSGPFGIRKGIVLIE